MPSGFGGRTVTLGFPDRWLTISLYMSVFGKLFPLKRLIIQHMRGLLSHYVLNIQWNHFVKCFLFLVPTWKLLRVWITPESHIVLILPSHVNLRPCDWLAICPGYFPVFCPVHARASASPRPPMTPNGIKRVEKKEEWMSASMWSTCTLQLTGRLTG